MSYIQLGEHRSGFMDEVEVGTTTNVGIMFVDSCRKRYNFSKNIKCPIK